MKTIVPEISQNAIYEYNHFVQEQKGEGAGGQYSLEKLGITDWSIVELNADEVLDLQNFVESSQTVPSAYLFWKFFGRHVTMRGLAQEVLESEELITPEAKEWVSEILSSNYSREEVERSIKGGEIYPPILFFPMFNGEVVYKGLLKAGNILDGNGRLKKVSRYLLECSDEERENFRITCFIGKADVTKYATINAQYFIKPTIKKTVLYLKQFMGNEAEKINDAHFMTFFERWYLLLQRIGHYK